MNDRRLVREGGGKEGKGSYEGSELASCEPMKSNGWDKRHELSRRKTPNARLQKESALVTRRGIIAAKGRGAVWTLPVQMLNKNPSAS